MWRSIITFSRNFILLLAFIALLAPEWPAFGDEAYRLAAHVGARQFDFASWTIEAFAVKREAQFAGGHHYLTEGEASAVVLDYLEQIQTIRQNERRVEQIYSDPEIDNPEEATADLQATIAIQRVALSEIQPIAEAIVQEQVTAVLIDEEFGFAGQLFPPVRMHMSPLPSIAIISPRDEITQAYSIVLKNGVSTPDRASLEQAIYDDLDLSAYVTNIGGLALYPTMIIETNDLTFLTDVVAHEWSHIWFGARPLGINYGLDNNVRTINESAAGLIGEEVGAEVLRRYYPHLAPPPPPVVVESDTPSPEPTPDPNTPPPFDFRAEMGETRIQVDELIGAGEIEAAEQYMEERRQHFVANGYNLRVLNQAYFAFHGAYAEQGGGASGRDPIGPLVSQIRDASPSLKSFMQQISTVDSYEQLLAVAAELGLEPEAP